MNLPASDFPRRHGARRWRTRFSCLLAGLLTTTPLACLQTASATTPDAQSSAGGPIWGTDPQPDLAAFSVWAAGYAKAHGPAGTTAAPGDAVVADGVQLAGLRRMVLAAVMRTDPARALAAGVPDSVRATLPDSVLKWLETPFSAVGDLSVDPSSGRRAITLNGRTYEAHVSGQQPGSASRQGVPLRGFTLDDQAVVDARATQALAADGTPVKRSPIKHFINGNDLFSRAYMLTGNGDSVTDSNAGATKEFGEPNHAGNPGGASVWYVWTPPNTGRATFLTDDGSATHFAVDTLLAVYTGTSVDGLSPVASNDDTVGRNSQVSFNAVGGVTYHIAVDGYNDGLTISQGSFTLTFFQQGDPLSPAISSDLLTIQLNSPFTYSILASNNPTSYAATGLPPGLTLDPVAGVISGSPTTSGTYAVLVSATNVHGTGSAQLSLTVTDQVTHLPFFSTEVSLPQSPGFYYLHLVQGNIFGYYAYLDDPNFIYHLDLGFEYTIDAGDGSRGIYLYDFTSNTFFYTSPRFPFPYLYDFSLDTVLYYFPSPTDTARYNTDGVRYFYNFSTGQIITK